MKNQIINLVPGLKETDGEFGLEIEAEGDNLPTNINPLYWRIDVDHSLKSGFQAYEYVVPKPGSLHYIREALNELERAYKAASTKVIETQTSGVHVHVNVQQFTPKQMFTFIATYFVLEELLLTYCGPNREGNHFCLRAKDAEWLISCLTKAAKTRKLNGLNTDQLRYASLNVFSLFQYGSIEFRAMRGTPDLNAIYNWVEIIGRVKEASLQFASPYEVIVSMSEAGEELFLERVLGDKTKLFKKEGYQRMIREGCRLIQGLAFSIDWTTYKDVIVNPFKQKEF